MTSTRAFSGDVMRLLVISNALPGTVLGGYEHATADLVRAACRRGWDVRVVTSNWSATSRDVDIPAQRVLRWNFSTEHPSPHVYADQSPMIDPNAAAIHEAIENFRPDRVLLMNVAGVGIVSILAPILNAGISTTAYLMDNWPQIRSSQAPWGFDWILSPLLRFCDIQWIASSAVVAREIELMSVGAVKSTVMVPAWTDIETTSTPTIGNPKHFVFVSTLSQSKGAEAVLDAFVLLHKRDPDIRLDYFGDGPLQRELEERAAGLPPGAVTFHGWVPRACIRERLSTYGALVFPTWEREPFGFVVLEAMAAGIPVISTVHGGTKSLPSDTYVTCLQSPDSIARAMKSLIDKPRAAQEMADRAVRHVREHHSESMLTGTILDHVETYDHTRRTGAARGLRENATLEALGNWLDQQQPSSPPPGILRPSMWFYKKLPVSVRVKMRPLLMQVYRRLTSRT